MMDRKKWIKESMRMIRRDLWSIRYVILVLGIYFFLAWNIFYSSCPFVMITGFPCYSEGRVSAGMVPASVYLWNWFIDGSFCDPEIYSAQRDGIFKEMADLSFGRNVCVLYLQDDPLLSGRTANELLSGESSEPDCSGVSSAE